MWEAFILLGFGVYFFLNFSVLSFNKQSQNADIHNPRRRWMDLLKLFHNSIHHEILAVSL
jgi:hypothetical protein